MMYADEETGIDLLRLPVNKEEHRFESWEVKYTKSHILSSKCTKNEECNLNNEVGDDVCTFCKYVNELQLPHLPDMVFPNNILTLKHDSGCTIEFNSFCALKSVSNGKMEVKVACSEAWKESRAESGHTETVLKPFDWTFTTDYKGTLSGNWKEESTHSRIDIDKLRQKEKILFFEELTLFEDELHDNGIASLSVKIRVMPTSFFILLRYFLRVDNVLIKVNDTRIYHEYDNDFLLREYTSREAKIPELKVPPHVLLDPNMISQHLPLVKFQYDKLILGKTDQNNK